MKNLTKFFSLVVLCALLSSCSSTQLVSSWKKQDYTPQKYNNILVLGVGKNTSGRAAAESAVATELNKQGIHAITALEAFPNFNPDVKLEKAAVAEALKEKKIDGLLVLSVLDVKSEEVYVQGHSYQQPVGQVYHPSGYTNQYYANYYNYYGYYSTVYETVEVPGYYENQTTYFLESNFYNVATESLTWSGQCHSINPNNVGEGTKEWATEVVNGMKKDKIFLQ